MERWDLIVVGAGPAGATAAITARRNRPDARVLLIDRATFPRDKACGDAIAAHAFEELAHIGVSGIEDDWPEVWDLDLLGPGGHHVTGRGARPNRIIPRVDFDARLVEHAAAAGAVVRTERVRTLETDGSTFVVNRHLRAPHLIAADGANSTIRRLVQDGTSDPRHRTRSSRHHAIAIRAYARTTRHDHPTAGRAQHIEFLADGWPAYAWSFPLPDGRANIGYGLRTSQLRGGGRPELLRRLRQALPEADIEEGTVAGHPLPFSTGRPPATGRGVLFVGDAAGLINPLTGEGIFYAIASGRMAAQAVTGTQRHPALLSRPDDRYDAMLTRRFGTHFATTSLLARLLDIPSLMPIMIRAGRYPAAFADLAEIGLGEGRLTPRLLRAVLRGALQRR